MSRTGNQNMTVVNSKERSRLERSGRLHWFHWVVVGLSLALTLGAWQFSKKQVHKQVERQFDREYTQVIALVKERMIKYEDALWAGVGLYSASSQGVDLDQWKRYSESIRIEQKYPGIMGIGVIKNIPIGELGSFQRAQREERPGFTVYPEHDRDISMPITYIEPIEDNDPAVGLDMAHETNRLTAALRARDTGTAQITGPIVLVQDSARTPGFLFFAPMYSNGARSLDEAEGSEFTGLVYAPFVVQRLMEGTLDDENRHVGIRLSDGDEPLYDELISDEDDFDDDPLFKRSESVAMFGREWNFDIWSSKSFRVAQQSTQPQMILIGGIIIDCLLIGLFVLLTRANRYALAYADDATAKLQDRNGELEQFVYTASHDLKSPLLTIQGFAGLLQHDIKVGEQGRLHEFAERIQQGADRMRRNIDDLLELSRIGRVADEQQVIEPSKMIEQLVAEFESQIEDAQATVSIQPDMPLITADADRIRQVFANLLANALKYGTPEMGQMHISIEGVLSEHEVQLSLSDNGPGIDPMYREKIFGLFQRLESEAEGTGVGLAIAKRVADVHNGRIWVEDAPGGGAKFVLAIPRQASQERMRKAA